MPTIRPNNFTYLPEITKNLLIINVILFIAKYYFDTQTDINLAELLGLHYWNAADYRPYQWVTYMFMHGNFAHLFFNMFALWMFGAILENVWGAKRFLFYYLFCGLGAALFHYGIFHYQTQNTFEPVEHFLESPTADNFKNIQDNFTFQFWERDADSPLLQSYYAFEHSAPSALAADPQLRLQSAKFLEEYRRYYYNNSVVVGASGAIFGILLAFGVLFPNVLLYVYFFVPIKAKYFVVIYGLLELVMGLGYFGISDNVAHFAHLGGMLFGGILLLFWRKNNMRKMLD